MFEIEETKDQSCIGNAFAIVLLPLLFLVALALGYVGIIPLQVEVHTLAIVSFIFLVFVLFVKHNANYAVCHMRRTFGRMEQKLQEALKANALSIMGKTKSTLHVKSFVEEYYKDIRSDNFAKVAPSVFPMLGILGTFVAIAISMPDFTVKNLDTLDREISLLLSGIGTAFYASIYGIALSLIWTYFEKRGSTKVEKRLYELERIYEGQVWKEAELIKHRHMQSELKDQEIVQTLKETFNMDFIRELNEQYLKHFTAVISEATEGFRAITHNIEEVSSSLQKTLEKIHDREAHIKADVSLRQNLDTFAQSTERMAQNLKGFDASVDHTFNKIDAELAGAVGELGALVRILAAQNQEIETMLKQHNREDKSDVQG